MAREELLIQVTSRGVRTVNRQMLGLQQNARGAARGTERLGAVLTGADIANGARSIARLGDGFIRLQNNLKIAGLAQDQLGAGTRQLSRIAIETRANLEATSDLYSRTSLAAESLGASQQEIARVVEIANKSLAIQGTTAQQASGTLLQLSQAFGAGRVEAEEFNSIIDGARPLLQAAANNIDAAGGSVFKLKALVKEGEIDSKKFFEAILKGGTEIDAKFAQTDATIGQALENLRTGLVLVVGALESATGILSSFTRGLSIVASLLRDAGGAFDGASGTVIFFGKVVLGANLAIIKFLDLLRKIPGSGVIFPQEFFDNLVRDTQQLVQFIRTVEGARRARDDALLRGNPLEVDINKAISPNGPRPEFRPLRPETNDLDGLEDGIRRITLQAQDLGSTISDAVVSSFNSAEDAIVRFVATGKGSFQDLADSILADITRIAVQKAITQPIANFLFGQTTEGPSGTTRSGGFGDFIGAGIGSLFGFAGGADFAVGGSGGPDSQVVAFRATPGERVKVEQPGQTSGGGGEPTVVQNFTFVDGDRDSIRKSQNEIAADASVIAERARFRNR